MDKWASTAQFVAFLVFASLFAITSVINIIAGFFEAEKTRKISKPFCLLFLGTAAAIAIPNYWLIYVGAYFGMIGDFFLIFKTNRKCFITGTISFLLGHFCYIAHTIIYLAGKELLPWYSYLIMIAFYIVVCLAVMMPIWGLTKHSKLFTISGTFYCATLLSVIASGALGVYFLGPDWYLLVMIGGMFFFASDLILTSTIFRHDFPRRDFYIMLTYLLGEAGIVFGVIFTIL